MTLLKLSLEGWGGLENWAMLLAVPGDWLLLSRSTLRLTVLVSKQESSWDETVRPKFGHQMSQRLIRQARTFIENSLMTSARERSRRLSIHDLTMWILNLGSRDLHMSLRGFPRSSLILLMRNCLCGLHLISLTSNCYIMFINIFPDGDDQGSITSNISLI